MGTNGAAAGGGGGGGQTVASSANSVGTAAQRISKALRNISQRRAEGTVISQSRLAGALKNARDVLRGVATSMRGRSGPVAELLTRTAKGLAATAETLFRNAENGRASTTRATFFASGEMRHFRAAINRMRPFL